MWFQIDHIPTKKHLRKYMSEKLRKRELNFCTQNWKKFNNLFKTFKICSLLISLIKFQTKFLISTCLWLKTWLEFLTWTNLKTRFMSSHNKFPKKYLISYRGSFRVKNQINTWCWFYKTTLSGWISYNLYKH